MDIIHPNTSQTKFTYVCSYLGTRVLVFLLDALLHPIRIQLTSFKFNKHATFVPFKHDVLYP